MTATTHLIPPVTDYLVTQCQAHPLLGAANPPVIILDGPATTADTLAGARHIWIGHDPHSDAEPAAVADQDFATMGDQAATRDETGEIVCAADAWGGATTLKTHRDDCAAMIAVVELMLRGRPQTGGPGDFTMGGLVLWSQVQGPYQWYPRQTQSGAGALCVFRVTYRGRLTT